MRILALVTDAFGGQGGIAKFNRDLLSALCTAPEVEMVVALPRLFAGPSEELPARLKFDTCGVGGKMRYAFAVLKSSLAIRPSPFILCGHINLLPLAFLARWFLRRARPPSPPRTGRGIQGEVSNSSQLSIVLVIHGIDAWQPTRSALVNRLVRQVDLVVAVSEFTRKKFWDWARPLRARSFILPNCVDLAKFTPGPKQPALLERYGLRDQTVLLTVARLSALERYKGIDQVLEVMPVLAKETPNLVYLIVGDGTDRARLMEKARTLGLRVSVTAETIPSPPRTGRGQGEVSNSSTLHPPPSAISSALAPLVIFAGHVPESEKVEHYRLADAFVMPGWGEGFGIVYLEAMACGVPVVASKLDASQEAVQGGKLGNVVNPRVPDEIVSGTLMALRSPKGVPAGLDHFSQAHFQRRVHALVGELAAR